MSDTAQIILAVIGTGITLLGILAGLLVSLFRILRLDTNTIRQEMVEIRQEIKETNTRIESLEGRLNARIDTLDARFTSRIDALYQALFSHKDPAA